MWMRWLVLWLLLLPGTAAAREAPVLAVVGDSLSAAFGIPVREGWVSLLQQRLAERGYPHRVVNASVTGDTTRGGLSRLPGLLERERPEVVIIELGGNDGLRGITPDVMAANLRRMVRQVRGAGGRALLLGVELPANYGNAFRKMFHDVYYAVGDSESVDLVPSFLEGVAMNPDLMQADGIHPNEKAQPLMLDAVWPALEPLLAKAVTGDVADEG
jgi:acyl-CoA thioesterase-1